MSAHWTSLIDEKTGHKTFWTSLQRNQTLVLPSDLSGLEYRRLLSLASVLYFRIVNFGVRFPPSTLMPLHACDCAHFLCPQNKTLGVSQRKSWHLWFRSERNPENQHKSNDNRKSITGCFFIFTFTVDLLSNISFQPLLVYERLPTTFDIFARPSTFTSFIHPRAARTALIRPPYPLQSPLHS